MLAESQIILDALLDNLEAIRQFINSNCGKLDIDTSTQYDLVLAVDEVCTNIITHGYEGKKPGPITLKFIADEHEITIIISDNGQPFDPQNAPSPELTGPWEDRPVGGLGVHILKQVADRIEYVTEDSINHLRIVKKYTKN